MKDNKQELSTEKMEKVSGGGWEQVIPLATEVIGKLMDSGGKDDSGSGQSEYRRFGSQSQVSERTGTGHEGRKAGTGNGNPVKSGRRGRKQPAE